MLEQCAQRVAKGRDALLPAYCTLCEVIHTRANLNGGPDSDTNRKGSRQGARTLPIILILASPRSHRSLPPPPPPPMPPTPLPPPPLPPHSATAPASRRNYRVKPLCIFGMQNSYELLAKHQTEMKTIFCTLQRQGAQHLCRV